MKHINMMYHDIRKLIKNRKLIINLIESSAILMNGLTKALFIAFIKKY